MEIKGIFTGAIGTIMVLLTIGVALGAVAQAGSTITVPQGKTMLYYIVDTTQAQELRDAICHNNNHDEERDGTCNDYAQEKIKDYFKQNIQVYRKWQHEQAYDEGTEVIIE